MNAVSKDLLDIEIDFILAPPLAAEIVFRVGFAVALAHAASGRQPCAECIGEGIATTGREVAADRSDIEWLVTGGYAPDSALLAWDGFHPHQHDRCTS